jgi:mRNA interferase RelE/StbE
VARAPRRLRVPPRLAALIRGLHPEIKRKLRHTLGAIVADPACGKALKAELAGLRSLRLGRFRVIYRIASAGSIDLVAFGPRERIYEETHRRILARPEDTKER